MAVTVKGSVGGSDGGGGCVVGSFLLFGSGGR